MSEFIIDNSNQAHELKELIEKRINKSDDNLIIICECSDKTISSEIIDILSSYDFTSIGYVSFIIICEKKKRYLMKEAEETLLKLNVALSYVKTIKYPFNLDEVNLIIDDILQEKIHLPYNLPFSNLINKVGSIFNV